MLKRLAFIALIIGVSGSEASASASVSFNNSQFSEGSFDGVFLEDGNLKLLGKWELQDTPLTFRNDFGLAYDSLNRKAVIFGGRDHSGLVFGDTWEWDSVSGYQLISSTSVPSARYGHEVVWIGDKYLLFGGRNEAGEALNDTWLYDVGLDSWTYLVTPSSPEARAFMCLGYDPFLNKAVLITGEGSQFIPVANTTWEFDPVGLTWSSFALNPAPSPRIGASMAYDEKNRKFVLFGGHGLTWNPSDLYNDTWVYDAATRQWLDMNPSESLGPRIHAAMLFDSKHQQTFLFGGLDNQTNIPGGSYFYDVQKNRWAIFNALTSPLARYGHEMFYDTEAMTGVVLAGRRSISAKTRWDYILASTGIWTSSGASVENDINVEWENINVSFDSLPLALGTTLFIQVAYSTDGMNFGPFIGPDLTTTGYYSIRDGNNVPVTSSGTLNRFVKVKALFSSEDIPTRFDVSGIQILYNRSPFAPVLADPVDGKLINNRRPRFYWEKTVDLDGLSDEPLSYELSASQTIDFSGTVLSTDSIAGSSQIVNAVLPSDLSEGTWYWRVRAKDAKDLYGPWSDVFQLQLDTTTPPNAIAVATATRGPAHGEITLTWMFSGDVDGGIENGQFKIHYSSDGPILSASDWDNAAGMMVGTLTATTGDVINSTLSSLEENTTYYFAVKTVDENGNVSDLSTVSTFAKTNNTPAAISSATLSKGPQGGDVTVQWVFPGDESNEVNQGEVVARHSLTPINNETDWSTAIGETTEAYTAQEGDVRTVIVTGLNESTSYYFAFKLRDALGQWSALSSARPMIETNNPPEAIASISAERGAGNGTIDLIWQYPGDDDDPTVNGIYLIKYSTLAPILNETQWGFALGQSSGVFSGTAGDSISVQVSGLASGTTHFFAVKHRDKYGSWSGLSLISPSARTNSAPAVTLLAPLGPGLLTNPAQISWTAMDPEGDVLTFALRLSPNGGASFPILISSGLASNVYNWNIEPLPNGQRYRLRVEAMDSSGLQSWSDSTGDLIRAGYSRTPQVEFIAQPAANQVVGGSFVFQWRLIDPSPYSFYDFNLYLSTNGGGVYQLIHSTDADSFLFDSTSWANGSAYRVKLESRDSSSPPLLGEAVSNIFSIHNNSPPSSFQLIRPLADDFPSLFNVTFVWESAVDVDGDAVEYCWSLWTEASSTYPVVQCGLNGTSYTPAITGLPIDVALFWKVTASDQQSSDVDSAVGEFIISRRKARSPDRLMMVEVLSDVPNNVYLGFENAANTRRSILDEAELKTRGDRQLTWVEYPAWGVHFTDISSNQIYVENPLIRITMEEPSLRNSGEFRIARLDEQNRIWRVLGNQGQLNALSSGYLSVIDNQVSIYSVLGVSTANGLLSALTNFPNPFPAGRKSTQIQYVLTADANVTIHIYDLFGDLVRTLEFSLGTDGGKGSSVGWLNEVSWDGKNSIGAVVANGMYIAAIHADTGSDTDIEYRRIGVLK